MSVLFRYRNGFVGVVSEAVATIMQMKGQGYVVEGKPAAPKPFVPKAAETEEEKQ